MTSLDILTGTIKNATTLNELHEALIQFQDELDELYDCDAGDRHYNYDLDHEMAKRDLDICDLPNWGPWPADTIGIWSWDKTHQLAGNGRFADWEIQERYADVNERE